MSHYFDERGYLDERGRAMLEYIDELRVNGVVNRVRALLPDAKARECGIRLKLASGWFVSAEVADDVPLNTMEIHEWPPR